jgi:23S rRNA (uracil1939-C5)-methyltransferase
VQAFFQGNRFLLERLVQHVAAQVEPGSAVVDLYAGAGLFAIAVAAARHGQVTAVEGDRYAAEDLAHNASAAGGLVTPVHDSVEAFTRSHRAPPAAVVADPPRTGLSRDALDGAIALSAPRFIYVSCDIATLARDARRLVDSGYTIQGVSAFDLFPNTPHVETVAVFERPPG